MNDVVEQLANLGTYLNGPGLGPYLKTRLFDVSSLQKQSRHFKHTDTPVTQPLKMQKEING
jgi:hypothetical protein